MSDDLNASIRRWRDALSSRESIKTGQLDELQDHLETELQRIPRSGINDEERVLLAARRVGSPTRIDREFFDADPSHVWRRRVLWMVIGFFVFAKLPAAVMSLCTVLITLALALPFPSVIIGPGILAATVLSWSAITFVIWRRMRGRPMRGPMAHLVRQRPGRVLAAAVIVFLAAGVIHEVAFVLTSQWVSASALGELAIWHHVSGNAVGLLVPIGLAVVAWHCLPRPTVKV